MKKLYIAFVWHMHQPLYKDELTERFYLPWVRLHAVKGYYDMPALLEGYPRIKQTFNLTPSLLYQLRDYLENPNVKDEFLEATLKPAQDLGREDKEFILLNFFMNSWPHVVKPHPRYAELLNKRGAYSSREEICKRVEKFEQQDFLDLQVLFNLMWFGHSYRKKEPRLQELMQKQKGYTEAEKREVIDYQFRAMKEIIPLYRRLAEQGRIEVTTSPFYHPILPLMYDRQMGYAYLWEEDSRWQVREGIRYYEHCFSARPQGLWPSEGSVSQDILPLFAEEGVRWIASDEEILLRSICDDGGGERNVSETGKREALIYEPYKISLDNASVTVIFRDKVLSDLIGFSYANSDARVAAQDFLRRLRSIREQFLFSSEEHLVSIILDGENAWEHYRYGGERFLAYLYEGLQEDPAFETVTVSDYLTRFPPLKALKKLFAGSWINHDFKIWYGHEEDRLAWDYLAKTRDFLISNPASEAVRERAWREIYAAEGSDWFWWYGDDFESASDEIFDYLFRNHLMNVYRLMGRRYPAYLKKPIKRARRIRLQREPVAFIFPTLDGRVTTFYEWVNAGHCRMDEPSEVMRQTGRLVSDIYYGFNLNDFFLRIDFATDATPVEIKEYLGVVHFHAEKDFDAVFRCDGSGAVEVIAYENEAGQGTSLRSATRPGPEPRASTPSGGCESPPLESVAGTLSAFGSEGCEKPAVKNPKPAAAEASGQARGPADCRKTAQIADSFVLGKIGEFRIPFQVLGVKGGDQLHFNLSFETADGVVLEECPRHGLLGLRVPDESFEMVMWSV